jgi:hypothetical protein
MSIFFWESPGVSGSTSCAFALTVSQSSALQQAYFTWGAEIHEAAIAIGMGVVISICIGFRERELD